MSSGLKIRFLALAVFCVLSNVCAKGGVVKGWEKWAGGQGRRVRAVPTDLAWAWTTMNVDEARADKTSGLGTRCGFSWLGDQSGLIFESYAEVRHANRCWGRQKVEATSPPVIDNLDENGRRMQARVEYDLPEDIQT